MTSGIAKSMRAVPPLENGDRLTRAEFERRFDATAGLKKAELIEAVVYVPPPVSFSEHGEPHASLVGWLYTYCVATSGLAVGDNGSVRLDLDNMPQPDVCLMIKSTHGGQSRVDDDGYVVGAPELIAEVSASSASYDLHAKKDAYRRNGVREYLVWRVRESAFDWFVLRDDQYVELADRDGVFDSTVFPCLRLDAKALLTGNLAGVQRALNEALNTDAHKNFVAELAGRKM